MQLAQLWIVFAEEQLVELAAHDADAVLQNSGLEAFHSREQGPCKQTGTKRDNSRGAWHRTRERRRGLVSIPARSSRPIQPESAVYGALARQGELRVTLPMRLHLYSMHACAATDTVQHSAAPRHC
jgi:hypothetical protein